MVTSRRSNVPGIRVMFRDVAAGKTSSTALNSPGMQADARAGVLPAVHVEHAGD